MSSPHQSPSSVTKSPTLHSSRTCLPPSQAPCFTLALPLSRAICNKEPSYPVQMSEHILGGGQWLPRKSHSPHSSHGAPCSLSALFSTLFSPTHPLCASSGPCPPLSLPSRPFCPSSTCELRDSPISLLGLHSGATFLGLPCLVPSPPRTPCPPARATSDVYFYFLICGLV